MLNDVLRFLPIEPGTESVSVTMQLKMLEAGESAGAKYGWRLCCVVGRPPWLSSADVEVCPGTRKGVLGEFLSNNRPKIKQKLPANHLQTLLKNLPGAFPEYPEIANKPVSQFVRQHFRKKSP